MSANQESLRRYPTRVMDHLCGARPRTILRLMRDALAGLCRRADTRSIFLLAVREREDSRELTLIQSWSHLRGADSAVAAFKAPFPLVRLGRRVESVLMKSTNPVYVTAGSDGSSCSRLMLRFLESQKTVGCVLVPIRVNDRLAAVLMLAHDHGVSHLESNDYLSIQLTGTVMMMALKSIRNGAKLRRRHRRWKAVADNACDFAVVLDQEQSIRQVVPFRRQQDLPATGQLLASLVDPNMMDRLERTMEAVLQSNEPQSVDLRAAFGEEQPQWYLARFEPQTGRHRRRMTVFLTNVDVQKQKSEELRVMNEHLQRAARLSLLGQLSTEFAHQLNQPLQAIMNWADTLLRRIDSGKLDRNKGMESLQHIIESAEHASRIIQRIREFVQHRTLHLKMTGLRRLVDQAIRMAEPRLTDHQIKLTLVDRFEETQPMIRVYADETQTTHVLLNLIVNAAESCNEVSDRAGHITVILEPDQSQHEGLVVVRVSDNGTGIQDDNPDHVFDKFHSTKAEGLGLGLSISREVIETQRGKIWCENNPDTGCTFSFTLRTFSDDGSDTVDIPVVDDPDWED
ncbi:MAG: GHKL domain-containing protein [Planctomycetaceae bacterium]|nr:GHKL domain-containing protein [Planctomycetaceae bacterium]